MTCPICEQRKAKRGCPAKGTKICSVCCGTEREVTISCPLDCNYLREGREREWQQSGLEAANLPFPEIRVDDRFLADHGELLEAVARAALTALTVPSANDRDIQQALQALAQTWKTLESGIHYESRADSAFGREIARSVREGVERFQQEERERRGMAATRDSDVLKMLVFFYRLSLDRANARPRGRAFLHFLAEQFDVSPAPSAADTPIIVPGR